MYYIVFWYKIYVIYSLLQRRNNDNNVKALILKVKIEIIYINQYINFNNILYRFIFSIYFNLYRYYKEFD